MKVRLIILCGLLLNIIFCIGQTTPVPQLDKSIIQPSPDVASFAKYGTVPVTLYAGKTNNNIPIYEVKQPKIGTSIALTYNYGGYRPAEVASSVGLGWDLQAGGVITRQVKDKVDEQAHEKWADFPDINIYLENQKAKRTIADKNPTYKIDIEPDIYHFNVGGYTGKFLLIKDRALLIPQQDIRIIRNAITGNFTMWAPDGSVYEFNDKESTQVLDHSNSGNAMNYTSAWQLTKILSPNRQDTIKFLYDSWVFQSGFNDISESYTIRREGGACGVTNNSCNSWTVTPFDGTIISAKRIKEISSTNCRVEFIKSTTPREDLANNNTSFTVNEIKIFDKASNSLLKKVKLYYDYFMGGTTKTKLKLTKVDMVGYLGVPSNPNPDLKPESYGFEYANETVGDFPAYTKGIDKWGYYNGANNFYLFNQEILAVPYVPIYGNAERNVNTSKVKNGILTKITYPTKGYSIFDYEQNKVEANQVITIPQTLTGVCTNTPSGPAIKTCYVGDEALVIEPVNPNGTQTITVDVSRELHAGDNPPSNTNSMIVFKVFLETDLTNHVYQMVLNAMESKTETFSLPAGSYIFKTYCKNNTAKITAVIHYVKRDISNAIDGPGLRIKTISSFDNVNNTTPAFVKSFEYSAPAKANMVDKGGKLESSYIWNNCPIQSCSYEGGSTHIYSSNIGVALAPQLNEIMYYPEVVEKNNNPNYNGKTVYRYNTYNFANTSPDLTEQLTYDNTDKVLAKTKNAYIQMGGAKSYWAGKISLVWSSKGLNCSGPCSPNLSPLETDTYFDEDYDITPYLITSYYNVLTQKTEFQYNGTDELMNTTNYLYENANHTMPTKTVSKNSKGEEVTTEIKYPVDYTQASSCGTDVTEYNNFNTNRNSLLQQTSTNIFNRNQQALNIKATQGQAAMVAYLNNPANNFEGIAIQQYSPIITAHSDAPITMANCLISEAQTIPFPPYINSFTAPLFLMQANNIINKPAEQMSFLKTTTGAEYLQNAVKNRYTAYGNGTHLPESIFYTPVNPVTVTKNDFLANKDAYYKEKIKLSYAPLEQIRTQSLVNNLTTSYIYGYKKTLPIAEVVNTTVTPSAMYSGFEDDLDWYKANQAAGELLITGGLTNTSNSFTGTKSFQFNTYNSAAAKIEMQDMPLGNYKLSFWQYGNNPITVMAGGTTILPDANASIAKNGWVYNEYTLTNTADPSISSSTAIIDDIKIYPVNALMSTYTYEPLVGITSKMNPTNQLSRYIYDGFGRLMLIKDIDNNILKKFCYNLAGQQEECNTVITYYNSQLSQVFTKNNCTGCDVGSQVTYTVAANTYSSTISQAAADQLAQNDVNANGQQYANTNGTCTPPANGANVPITYSNTVGYTGFTVTYSGGGNTYTFNLHVGTGTLGCVPAGVYSISISKPGNTDVIQFYIGCATISGTSALFKFRTVNTSSCNIVNIDL